MSNPGLPPPDTRATPRWRGWLKEALITLLLAGGLLTGVSLWRTLDAPTGAAPEFAGMLVRASQAAAPVRFSDWRAAQGRQPVLLYFWAEWCPICKLTQGAVQDLSATYPVLGIAMQSGDAAAVQREVQARQFTWPSVADPQGSIAATYRFSGVPAFVVIDADGQVRFTEMGFSSTLGLRLRLWWAGFRKVTA